MTRAWAPATALLIFLLPLGTAHDPAGTPKDYCEYWPDVSYHEYAGVNGPLLPLSGNLTGDCDNAISLTPDRDGHDEFAIGGAFLHAGHHGNTICVEGALLYEINSISYTAPCTTVSPSTTGYTVTVLAGTAGHIYTPW